MYQLKKSETYFCDKPWDKLCEERLGALKKAKKLNKKTVAFLYPGFDSSTFRYRGYNVSETLEYSFQWAGSYFQRADVESLDNALEYVDVLVLIRCDWDEEIETLIEHAKEKGISVAYDVDDLIYNPKYMPIVIKTLGLDREKDWNFWYGLTLRNHMVASMCDAYITTNEYLAEYLRDDFGKPCFVIKNYLNWIQETVSKEYFAQKQTMESQGDFEIGYFSGSATHLKDIMVVMPEIERFLNKHKNAVLKIVGYMELPQEYDYLVKQQKIKYVPFQSFAGLQYEQAKVDVNIVPLVNNEFSNCKSELKYFETAIVGTITCATPTHTFKNAIQNGVNGYLCEKGEWFTALEKIYTEGVSKEKQSYIKDEALKVYGNINQVKLVEGVLDRLCDIQ